MDCHLSTAQPCKTDVTQQGSTRLLAVRLRRLLQLGVLLSEVHLRYYMGGICNWSSERRQSAVGV